MALLSTLLDRVHDELPSVPEALALRALSDAVKEFCSRTHYWQENLSPITLRPGEVTYELSLDTGTQLVQIKDVRLDGRKVYPVATEIPRLRNTALRAGLPRGYIQWQPKTIELVNAPLDGAQLEVKAALTLALSATATQLPDDLVDEYGEVIASAAKGRLMRQANQPWYAPDAVLGYMGPFYGAITTAKSRTFNALGDAEVQIEMRRW